MDIALVIGLGILLAIILAILILIFFSSAKKKKAIKAEPSKVKIPVQDLDSLINIIKNHKTSTDDLKNALNLILKDYGEIHDFNIYLDIIYRMTRHPNTNKDIIVNFDKELSKLNPTYKEEISKSVMDALNTRI